MKFKFFHNKSIFNIKSHNLPGKFICFQVLLSQAKKNNMHTTYFQNKRFCPILKSP